MRIPILVSGAPSLLKDSKTCKVYLHHGQWKLVCENLVDSQFSISLDDYVTAPHNIMITGPQNVILYFDKAGTETNLNIYATDDG